MKQNLGYLTYPITNKYVDMANSKNGYKIGRSENLPYCKKRNLRSPNNTVSTKKDKGEQMHAMETETQTYSHTSILQQWEAFSLSDIQFKTFCFDRIVKHSISVLLSGSSHAIILGKTTLNCG